MDIKKSPILSAALLLIVLSVPGASFAEKVVLKSGDTIEGNVIEKNNRYVKVDYKGAVVTYYPFEIESIAGKPFTAGANAMSGKPLDYLLESKGAAQGVAGGNAVTAEDYMARGLAFYNKAGYEQAIKDFNRAIKADPRRVDVYLYRGLAYMNNNNADFAIADYDKIIDIDPKNEEAYYVRGVAYSGKKDLDKAMADYNKAIEINADYVQAYLNRAIINVMKANNDAVIADIKKVMSLNPDIAMAYYIRGLFYANKNNMGQAISDYTKAIELNPNYVEAYVNRALAYAYKDKVDIDPNSPKAFINMGTIGTDKANMDKAIADCNKAIEIAPKYADAYLIRSRVYLLGNNAEKALSDVRQAETLGAVVKPEFMAEIKKAGSKGESKAETRAETKAEVNAGTKAEVKQN